MEDEHDSHLVGIVGSLCGGLGLGSARYGGRLHLHIHDAIRCWGKCRRQWIEYERRDGKGEEEHNL